MKAKCGFGAVIEAQAIMNGPMQANVGVKTHWEWEHWRNGKLIDKWEHGNVCTDEGLNALLDIMFHGSTQITAWYVLLFETDTTPAAGTTYATPVFTESTAYAEATRPAYTEAAASSKVTTNAANKAVFTINATKTIYGAALVGGGTAANTKGDTAGGGTMYCAAKFGASKSVVSADVLNVTIQITAADT